MTYRIIGDCFESLSFFFLVIQNPLTETSLLNSMQCLVPLLLLNMSVKHMWSRDGSCEPFKISPSLLTSPCLTFLHSSSLLSPPPSLSSALDDKFPKRAILHEAICIENSLIGKSFLV